jgi:hypothetical protein
MQDLIHVSILGSLVYKVANKYDCYYYYYYSNFLLPFSLCTKKIKKYKQWRKA